MNYRLSPSDLTFLYDSCKHCFVLKVKNGIAQPSIPIPNIFSIIASLQKQYYSGKRTEEFCPSLPTGMVTYGEKWVRSKAIEFTESGSTCFINGRFDVVAELDDGSFAVLDFKTGSPSEEKVGMYARQLQAYAFALENPAPEALQLKPISKLALLYFTPDKCDQLAVSRQVLHGELQLVEVQRNDEAFLTFLQQVVTLLDGPLPPPQIEGCDWCAYRKHTGEMFLSEPITVTTVQKNPPIPSCPVCGGVMRRKSGRYGDFWSCINYPNCKGSRNT